MTIIPLDCSPARSIAPVYPHEKAAGQVLSGIPGSVLCDYWNGYEETPTHLPTPFIWRGQKRKLPVGYLLTRDYWLNEALWVTSLSQELSEIFYYTWSFLLQPKGFLLQSFQHIPVTEKVSVRLILKLVATWIQVTFYFFPFPFSPLTWIHCTTVTTVTNLIPCTNVQFPWKSLGWVWHTVYLAKSLVLNDTAQLFYFHSSCHPTCKGIYIYFPSIWWTR